MRIPLMTGAAMLAATLALVLTSAGTASPRGGAATFTGYGFEACNAPPLESLDAWLASPYRAVGVYIGGINRSCANAALTATWVASALADGWSLVPTYVGLQAPCISNTKRARFTAANAQSSGTAAADDAIADATALGLPGGSPIYFDMEAYSVKDPTCTQTVQAFVSAWVAELHVQHYVAGVYGSASSTMRDLQTLATAGTGPDDVWIANWNGAESVFGDSYVSDALWTSHQRIHQYRGGHKETFGGVTINIDSDYIDAAVVGATAAPAASVQAGSTSSVDGVTNATWPADAFDSAAQVTLSSVIPGETVAGYGTGGYGVELAASEAQTLTQIMRFSAPLTLSIVPPSTTLAPVYSTNGSDWKRVPALTDNALAPEARVGYERTEDGRVEIQTTVAGTFALVPDRTRPSPPSVTGVRFADRRLLISWSASTDGNGPVTGYRVTLTNRPVATIKPGMRRDAEQGFHAAGPSVYRVIAIDAAGNESRPSKPIVVLPSKRPDDTPKAIPAWAWRLFDWQEAGKAGPRPEAPKIVPPWYWRWSAWRALPFHLRA